MLKIKKLKDFTDADLKKIYNRFGNDISKILYETVMPIINEVRVNGNKAVLKYTEKFDKVKLKTIHVSEQEIEQGYKNADPDVLNAFMNAKVNIEEFHIHQKRDRLDYSRSDGTVLGMFHHPIQRAAIYVPGGTAFYPSSLLMAAVPAGIAGTEEITIITPPDRNGKVADILLAVCRILGITRIIKCGGAQGIAAAGLGTETVKKSDIIVGPGNIYVTAAKAYLFSLGAVQIDSIAGPSEILIIADDSADPESVAYDLLAQAEHDENAESILVTTSEALADKVNDYINRDVSAKTGRHEIKKASLENNAMIILTDSIDDAIEFSNSYAPEHMELMVDNPMDYLNKIKNAGSLFLGNFSPVAAGDYYTGTNHILPTGGSCRFSSGLGVDTFLRRTTYQYLTREALELGRKPIKLMSGYEGLTDHGKSVEVRLKKF